MSDELLPLAIWRNVNAARTAAHTEFDPLWENIAECYRDTWLDMSQAERARIRATARRRAYVWLTDKHGYTKQIHIGDMTAEQCRVTVLACRAFNPAMVQAWYERWHDAR